MSYETIPVEMKDSGTVHVLTGTVTDTGDGVVDLDIDDYGSFADVPVFYHCQNEETADTGNPFSVADRVIIVNTGDAATLDIPNLKAVGFEDGLLRNCLIETVYVTMTVGTTDLCFVWNADKDAFADIKLNAGGQASFPCDPADISDWKDDQVGVGASLYSASDCGRQLWACGELLTGCPPFGWGTAGTCSGSKEEESNCGCDFMDTGECTSTWDLTQECNYPGDSGASSWSTSQNILWRKYAGGASQQKKFTFLNNSEVENSFRIELQHNAYELHWDCEEAACGSACDNLRLDSGIYSNIYKIHTPLALNILEINHSRTKNWDICNDSGAYVDTNCLLSHRLQHQGSYSEKIIAQIYTAEARTVTRSMNGAVPNWGGCCGDCTWQNVVYTDHGLNITAQVGVFKGDTYPDGTDGVDPTGLSRNSSFESAITGMYDTLRTAESIPDDEMANAIIELLVYRG